MVIAERLEAQLAEQAALDAELEDENVSDQLIDVAVEPGPTDHLVLR